VAGLDSINSRADSGSGNQPDRDDERFDPKTAVPFPNVPFAEPTRSGGDQGSNRASGLPGTPQRNPQDGNSKKPRLVSQSHSQAWADKFGGGGTPKAPGVGGPAGGAGKGAGGGKAEFAQKAADGVKKGLVKIQEGDIKGGIKEAAKGAVEGAGDAAADKLFYVMVQWALQTFTLSILIGWNLLLFLPWVIGAITGVKISLQLWQKAVIIAMDAIIVGIILLVLIIFTVTFCYGVSGKEFSLSAFSVNPAGYVAGQAAQYVLPQELVDFCSSVSGTKTGDFGGGGATDNYGNTPPGGPINTGQWKELVNKYAAKYQLDPCALNTLLIKESSGGDPNAIGHDTHQRSQDPFVPNTPPKYGLNFDPPTWSHGIGLIQPTIFPFAHRYGHWSNPSIPARVEWGHDYTIQELLDPEVNMDFGAHLLSDRLKASGGDYQAAFGAYNGSGRDGNYAITAMNEYNKCKSGQ
jgi:hypothetical protein